MNSDSYKIIISLSHHRITFEYWQRDGENKLVPMPNMVWPTPLAFYCSQTGIEIGEAAIHAVHSGTSNAFDKYFERLTNDETYVYGGQRKPLRYLLLDAVETIFSDFFKTVLFGSKGSLSDNRATMPITLVCESDIKANERALLLELFKSSGYNRFKVVEYNTFIERYIRTSIAPDYACDDVLVAWTEGDDLTFTLFNLKNNTEHRQVCFQSLGIDPRLNYVKNLIWDRVSGQNPWLCFSSEEETISRAAMDFLNTTIPLVNDTLILSDGVSYHYSLNRQIIDNLQCNEGVAICSKLDEFLRENHLLNRNKILLLLRGIASGNIFFEQTICQGFCNTIRSGRKLRDNTMLQLIADPNPVVAQEPVTIIETPHASPKNTEPAIDSITNNNPPIINDGTRIKEIKRKWREVNAQSSGMARDGHVQEAINLLEAFKKDCYNIAGTEHLINDIDSKLTSLHTNQTENAPSINPLIVKSIEREWREIRATAKGKARNGQSTEAIKILNDFIERIADVSGTDNILSSVRNELAQINPSSCSPKGETKHYDGEIHPNGKWIWISSAAGGKGDWRTIGGRIHRQSKETGVPIASAIEEGQQLIVSGKLKEARDWYRAAGNIAKAKVLSDLIRSQKGVELRKTSLEECRRNRNVDQIKRIISELQGYISQCNEVNYDCLEYRKLLSEYKKLLK